MKFINTELIKELKRKLPYGTRVKLIHMEDRQAPPKGTEGIVQFVDDAGNIHVRWSNGSSLCLLYDVDRFEVLKPKNKK